MTEQAISGVSSSHRRDWRSVRWLAALGLGCILAADLSWGLREAMKPPEIRNWEAGKPVFDHPVPKAYAKSIAQEIQERQRRNAIRQRAPMLENFLVSMLAFIVDPVNLIFIMVLTALSNFGIKAVSRNIKPT